MRNTKLLLLTLFLVPLFSCQWWITRDDLEAFRRDVREDVREELRAGEEERKRIEERQERKLDQVAAAVNEPSGLAGMITRGSPWSWFGIEFLLAAGFSFTAALRLRYKSRVGDLNGDDYKVVSFARKLLNTIGGRKPDPPGPPDTPDDRPPLRVVK